MELLLIMAIIFGPAVYTLQTCVRCMRDYKRCSKKNDARRRKLKWQAICNGVLCFLFSAAIVVLYCFLSAALKHM